jgi:hypothetical protein
MTTMTSSQAGRLIQGACLILGPAVFAASTFYWLPGGADGATSGTLLVLSLVFWTCGLIGLLEDLRARMPIYSGVVLLVLLYGVAGGSAFAVKGIFDELFGHSRAASAAALTDFPFAANLVFFWAGPLFPFALLLIGIGLGRTRLSPLWTSVLICVAGVAFPLSRVPRIGWLAHLVDLLILVAFGYLGYLRLEQLWRAKVSRPVSG